MPRSVECTVALLVVAVVACTDREPVDGGLPTWARGYHHLDDPTRAVTLVLDPDGGVHGASAQCDAIGLLTEGARWQVRDAETVELSGGTRVQPLDGGVWRVAPPLSGLRPGATEELWLPGAVCSVCLADSAPATVACASPDAGRSEVCCQGGCDGDVPVRAVCDGASCRCPAGSVSPGACTGSLRPFCSGAPVRPN